jgi:hypothetical protein
MAQESVVKQLLARRVLVLDQPVPDDLLVRAQHRRRPHRRLARRRHRVRQRLTHRAAVHPMPASQLPDRQPFVPAVPPDTFELLHPRSLLHSPTSRDRLGRRHGT